MRAIDGDPHAAAGDLEIGQSENLASFMEHFELFLGVSPLEELIHVGNHIERDLLWIDVRFEVAASFGECADLVFKFGDSLLPTPRASYAGD